MSTRWTGTDAPRGDDYDARWARLAAAGESIHGEADLVEALLREHGGRRVLDAGCGTGRVAIELAARGYEVVGVDLDAGMLAAARAKAPHLVWVEADLARLDDGAAPVTTVGAAGFDLVVMAGNVMIFVAPGTEGVVLGHARRRLVDGWAARGGVPGPRGPSRAGRVRPVGRRGRVRAGGAVGDLGSGALRRWGLRGLGAPGRAGCRSRWWARDLDSTTPATLPITSFTDPLFR